MSRRLCWLFSCILAGPAFAQDSFSPKFNGTITEEFTCNVDSVRCYFRCYGTGGQASFQHQAVTSVTIVQGTAILSNKGIEIPETQFRGQYIKPGPPPLLNKFSGFIQGPNASCETLGMDLVQSKVGQLP